MWDINDSLVSCAVYLWPCRAHTSTAENVKSIAANVEAPRVQKGKVPSEWTSQTKASDGKAGSSESKRQKCSECA